MGCPLIEREDPMYHHILIPTDGSELSAGAVKTSMSLAKHVGAKVTVLAVVEPFPHLTFTTEALSAAAAEYRQRVDAEADRHLGEAEQQAKLFGVHCETAKVSHGHPYQAIIETADSRGCDLIAMASHGRRGVSALILGSETTKVLTHSKLPVLVYR
jgi:nucleotide-binding universal stress UspA family protein